MSDYGPTRRFTRDKLPLQIVRGHYLTEPGKLTYLAAPLDAEGGIVPIKSGMIITLGAGNVDGVSVSAGFRPAVVNDNSTEGQSFYIAVSDADAHDVQNSGKLVGLDCSDTFEVQTGYYAADTYAKDDLLTAGADGVVKKAASGDVVIGKVTVPPFAYVGYTPGATQTTMIQFKTMQSGILKV